MRAISTIACGSWRTRSRHAVQILMGIRPAKDLSLTHTPDTAEDSKPTAELPLLLLPVAALQPRISAAERSRSLYFRCKKQEKQLVLRVIHTIHQAMTHHRSYQSATPAKAGAHGKSGSRPLFPARGGLRRESAEGTSSCIN